MGAFRPVDSFSMRQFVEHQKSCVWTHSPFLIPPRYMLPLMVVSGGQHEVAASSASPAVRDPASGMDSRTVPESPHAPIAEVNSKNKEAFPSGGGRFIPPRSKR